MRTTVTLDDDVAALLRKRQKERRLGFKEALNEALREALATPLGRARTEPRRPIQTYSVGRLLVEDLDDVSAVIEDIEGPAHR
jgi:hypothetical protein